ncbi:MAG: FecCD family ABC transporter permease [Chloroflexota bacterium]
MNVGVLDCPVSASAHRRVPAAFLVLGFVLVASVVAAVGFGRVPISAADQLTIVIDRLGGRSSTIDPRLASILLEIRLPRVLLAAVTGAALATAGAALQGLFRNPLADPYLVGVSSGASVGAVLTLTIGLPPALYAAGAVQLAAFVGAVSAVSIALLLARAGGRTSVPSLLLAGVAVAAIGGAVSSYLLFFHGERIFAAYAWLLGGFNAADWALLGRVVPPVVVSAVGLVALGPSLDLLQLDEEAAKALGLRVEGAKLATIGLASLATAAAVSAAGLIAFVGLVAPHVVRILVGPEHRTLLVLSALGGATFMVLADLAARIALPEGDLPVGVVTAAIGGPFFLALLWSRRERLA